MNSIKEKILNDINIARILDELKEHNAMLVGGYIRDAFYNKASFDKDIVVKNNSKEFAKIIQEKLGGTFIELDTENEIYRVVLEDKENYFDVSKALDDDFNKDAKRRDFTINSIYYDFKNENFFDPTFGLNDIKEGLLKTHNLDNFKDDPLRIIRVFRFFSLYDLKIDNKILNFIKENSRLIETIAQERVHYEIIKMFEGKNICKALIEADNCKFLSTVFPFIEDIKKIPSNTHHHLDLFNHSLETMRQLRKNSALLNLSAFCHDIGKPHCHKIEDNGRHRFIGHDKIGADVIKPVLKKLKFSKKEIEYITLMIENHIYPSALMANPDTTDRAKIRFIKKLDPYVEDIIELARADRLSAKGEAVSTEMIQENLDNLKELYKFYEIIKPKLVELPKLIDGKEIMEILNLKPSKKLGEIIEALNEAQLEEEVNTKEEAIVFIKRICNDM